MKITVKRIIGMMAFLLLGFILALVNGWIPITSKNTHPPCNQLPLMKEVTEALGTHKDFAKEIESLGKNIQVEIGRPCSDNQERALIQITYKLKAEEKSVRHLITISEGFGLPIYLVKR